MKTFKNYLSFAVIFAMLFTSCSKENESAIDDLEGEMASISFATVLNDLTANKAALKQAVEVFPLCAAEGPAYVEVVLTGTANVGTMEDPLVVNVNPNPGDYDEDGKKEYFTEESFALELEPGNYKLEYFAVYDVNDNIIWLAPTEEGGDIITFVDDPLPMDIELSAGVKKYVDVEVLCLDDRMINEYGYSFFDLESTEASEFCFFANLCDENGRHFPAHYSVDIWLGTDNTGTVIYSEEMNMVENEGGIASADPLCLALPDLSELDDNEEYIYYEVTIEDWEGVYGDVDQSMISGTLSRNDIHANLDGEANVDYEHLKFGCTDDGDGELMDSDEDGIPNSEDNCPNEVGSEADKGCPDGEEPKDSDEDGIPDSEDDCPNEAGSEAYNGCPDDNGEEPADNDEDGIPDSEDDCPNEAGSEAYNGCPDDNGEEPADNDEDGIPDSEDDCPNEFGSEANNGCPDENGGLVPCTIEDPANECASALLEGESGFVKVAINRPLDLYVGDELIGTLTVDIDAEGSVTIGSVLTVEGGYLWSGYQIYLSSSSSSSDIFAALCGSAETSGTLRVDFGDIDANYPIYIQLKSNVCPANVGTSNPIGDGLLEP